MLSAGPLAYGWILTAQAIGEGAMSVLLERTQIRGGRLGITGFVSARLTVGGLTLMLLIRLHTLGPCLLLNLIFGAITAGITVRLLTCLQQRVANHFLGHALATYSAIQALTKVSGSSQCHNFQHWGHLASSIRWGLVSPGKWSRMGFAHRGQAFCKARA
jgi:DHA3 family macrolide efflux protein-like MFS transporter